MATPKSTQVRDALQTLLEGITGTYATGAGRVIWFPFSAQALNTGHRTVIALAKDIDADERLTYKEIGVEMPIDIAACTRFEAASVLDPFNPPAKDLVDVQEELAQAVKDKIRSDLTLGGKAIDIVIPDEDYSYETTWTQGWAVVFLRAAVTFQHPETTS